MIESAPLRVTVGILTYLRPMDLVGSLSLVLKQVVELNAACPNEYDIDVLVVDNDSAGSARTTVASFGDDLVRYEIEARPGVSAARNRALDSSADADLLAFIDDDERPEPRWLELLLRTHRDTGAAAVAGRVIAEFDGELDPWIAAGGFFVRRTLPTGTSVEAAGAGNLLLDMHVVRARGLRFEEKYGLSGGEDTLFTRTLTAAGSDQLVWCNEAVIVDKVRAARMTRSWVLARSWSHGNTAGLIEVDLAGDGVARLLARARGLARGILRIGGGGVRLLFGVVTSSNRHRARGSRAIWRGAGMMVGALGFVFREYDRDSATGSRRRRVVRSAARSRSLPQPNATGDIVEPEFVVLQSFPATKPKGNPYRVLLQHSLLETSGLSVKNFTWQTALLSRYDAFHVHWPEVLLTGNTKLKSVGKQLLFMILLLRLKLTRTPIVRTVHNLELPSDISRREVLLLKVAERQTTLRIRINTTTQLAAGQPFETIVHGHYREWFKEYPVPETVPGRVTFFGLIRRYKGVDGLIQAFRETEEHPLETSLVIAGKPSTPELATTLRDLAATDPRVELLLHFIDDQELVDLIGQAELVVLPYREMHNSAGVLTALSLGRPVLIPDNHVNRMLSDEVGEGWVHLYSGPLAGRHITETISELRRRPPSGECNLAGREWGPAAQSHLRAYRRAAAIVGQSAASARIDHGPGSDQS